MRILPFVISAAVTAGLAVTLNTRLKIKGNEAPAFGSFLSPQHGFWQNAENVKTTPSGNIISSQLKGKASVYMDERLVPHVFAENDEDLYFIQGFLHAKYRLFQMDLQTKAAEGRASEFAGAKAIQFDREQRRIGMRYAAEKAVEEIGKDEQYKKMFQAYTNGVNEYISTLKESELPIEYKLLGFKPEKWDNIRTALLLKMMSKMLTFTTDYDLAATNAKTVLIPDELKILYPQVHDSLEPIVPKKTSFDKPGIVPVKPAGTDSNYFSAKQQVSASMVEKVDPHNGSNNWVVSGSKTKSGAPILCNDPHLELSLPSIWYEIQLSTPTSNVYGVSLPGSPFVIIGFNDSIAWGVTNAQRDVKDYFEIKFKDATQNQYWYNGKWENTTKRVEEIKVRGGATVYDTVAYTVFGPVTYDRNFNGLSSSISAGKNLAMRWTAHDASNEALTFRKLNLAKNYADYEEAIKTFQTPGQNFVFASKSGDIALWQQGKFPARWEGQGLYVMPGTDSSYNWQGFIPQPENPHSKNPPRGFLLSANQRPVDAAYPYFIPGAYISPRGIAITHFLEKMNGITVEEMKHLQNNYFNTLAEDLLPVLLKHVKLNEVSDAGKKYIEALRKWDLNAGPQSKEQTIYQAWSDSLNTCIWADEISKIKPFAPWPNEQTTLEILIRDTSFKFIDNVNTPAKEMLSDMITLAVNKAVPALQAIDSSGKMEWAQFKNPTVYHLLKENLLPFARRGLPVGGSGNIINAITHSHGPSWRMIVNLTSQTEAWGVFPGGQNGNPGSKNYDAFINDWAAGKYYPLWMMKKGEENDKKVVGMMSFSN